MALLSRLTNWMYPALPPAEPLAPMTLNATTSDAMERYAALANVVIPSTMGKPVWPDRNPYTYDVNGYQAVGLIYRCINLISHAAGTAPLRVYDERTDDDEVAGHPLRQLVRQPNPMHGEALFWGTVAMRAAIAGFCVVEKERNALGRPIALNPLRSAWLRAIPVGRGVYDWEYRIPGIATPYRLKAADVVTFTWADTPDGSPYGLPPIALCIKDAALITKMVDFLAVLFDRGGVPLYGLIPDTLPGQTLDQGDTDQMLEGFLRRRSGLDRAGIPMVLEGIKDIKRLGFDLDELAYTDLRDVSELEIARAFGVPPRKAITRVGLEHTTQNATASVEDGEFYRDTIVPLWTRFDDAMTTALLPDFEEMPTTVYLGFDTSDISALQENRNDRAPWLIQGFSSGAFSQHTIHRELGIPLPKTDDFYLRSIAVDVVPVDDPIPPAPKPVAVPPTQEPPQLGRVVVRELTAGSGPRERHAAAGVANRKLYEAIALRFRPRIAAFFTAEGERVLTAVSLAGLRRPTETFALTGIDWPAENAALLKILNGLYHGCGEASFAAASQQTGVGIDWDLSSPRIRAILDKLALRVTNITATSQAAIQEAVVKGAEDGLSIDELKDKLKTMFTNWSDARAAMVARTESQVAYNSASVLAYRESNVVDRIQCFDSETHCDDYGAADGLSCCGRNGLIDTLDSAELHIESEHPNGSLAVSPVLIGEEE